MAVFRRLTQLFSATKSFSFDLPIADPEPNLFHSAENDAVAASFMLFTLNCSTFFAKPGFYIEDLFMRDFYRTKGFVLGKMQLSTAAAKGEIAGSLDSALLVPIQISHSDKGTSQLLTLNQSATLLECLMSCWREDVLVLSCSDKFLRLSLRLISRYSHWVSAGLATRKAGNAGSTPGSEWAISAVPDDFIYIIHDLNCLAERICGDFLGHVVVLLSSSSSEVLDLVKQSILEGGVSLKDLIPEVINSIIQTVVEKSVEDLKQLKGITATYRMTNKPLPVRHSPYVSGVLRPLKTLLDGEQATAYLTRDIRNELVQGAALEITGRYYEFAADLVSVARKTESTLQRIRQGAQRRAGASSDVSDNNVSDTDVSDTDKICMQLFLDIQEYGRNLSALGVEAVKIPAFCSLWQVVAPTNRQNTISF
ncbi:hypothetical protein RHGRI_004098 [Rhododendron griersonianum]|uniref:COG complex component COG2 C-terminal domain-containing protein n=1 Tax=Rhododendron griersonianum TaxID=479676 RepID=A0AAV6L9M6_9ERIC|nr:hypothetical protein RHGRI_004098 [Rhododendron griersonianum]